MPFVFLLFVITNSTILTYDIVYIWFNWVQLNLIYGWLCMFGRSMAAWTFLLGQTTARISVPNVDFRMAMWDMDTIGQLSQLYTLPIYLIYISCSRQCSLIADC